MPGICKRLPRKSGKTAAGGAQIVCLQELFGSLYFCNSETYEPFDLAEPIPGPTTGFFAPLAAKLRVVLILSLFEKRAEGIYHNTAAVLDADGAYLGKYRKMHIPDDPNFYEKFYFTPGDLGYKVFETVYAKIGLLICWDQWFPEAARITALRGAELLFCPTAIGWDEEQDDKLNAEQYEAWQTVLRSHSVTNGLPVVSVNRTGKEGRLTFWGGSFVTGTFGEVLWQAPHESEATHIQEVDLSKIKESRLHWPFLRDRRIDSYEPVTQRFLDN